MSVQIADRQTAATVTLAIEQELLILQALADAREEALYAATEQRADARTVSSDKTRSMLLIQAEKNEQKAEKIGVLIELIEEA